MNQYGALELLRKLNINTLEFKKYYNKLDLKTDILVDFEGELYICKDKQDYEKVYSTYSWHIVGFYFFYDSDVDAIVFEYSAEDTDVDEIDHYDTLFAIVSKQFLEAYKINLDFKKEDTQID